MLESLNGRNFQSLKNVTIKFSPTVTTIIGPNDAGKSAFLRLLGWVTTNRPTGRAFIRHGTTQASGCLKVDGVSIRRVAGKGKNSYSIKHAKAKRPKVFNAFRNDVPDEIKKVLAMSEINFQRQHDAVFWFSLSPGQIAKELNRLVDLETIDRSQAWVGKRLRDTKAELDVCTKRLAAARAELKLLKDVEKYRKSLTSLQNLSQTTIPHINAQSRRIRGVLKQAEFMRRGLTIAGGLESSVEALRSLGTEGVELQTSISTLDQIIRDVRRYQRLASDIAMPNTSKIEPLIKRSGELERQYELLSQWIDQAKKYEQEICKCAQQAKKQKAQIEKALGGRCPQCGTILSNETLI